MKARRSLWAWLILSSKLYLIVFRFLPLRHRIPGLDPVHLRGAFSCVSKITGIPPVGGNKELRRHGDIDLGHDAPLSCSIGPFRNQIRESWVEPKHSGHPRNEPPVSSWSIPQVTIYDPANNNTTHTRTSTACFSFLFLTFALKAEEFMDRMRCF